MLNVKDVQLGTTTRKSFAKINEVMQMPNLIEVQKKSYQWFLDEGLEEVFRDIGSITDYTGNLVLDFIDYTMDEDPKYTIAQCKARDVTYAKPLKVRARLQNKETGEVKENIIFMGDFPLMTDAGTFVINGAERCIVSQLVRSPGVYYHMDHDKTGKELYTNTVIPNREAAVETAILGARRPAVVLLAGKGCEEAQKRKNGPEPCIPDGTLARRALDKYNAG